MTSTAFTRGRARLPGNAVGQALESTDIRTQFPLLIWIALSGNRPRLQRGNDRIERRQLRRAGTQRAFDHGSSRALRRKTSISPGTNGEAEATLPPIRSSGRNTCRKRTIPPTLIRPQIITAKKEATMKIGIVRAIVAVAVFALEPSWHRRRNARPMSSGC
jgi:hypothetical protein